MIKHEMRIVVRRPGEKPISIAQFKKLSLAKRLKTKWFGCSQKVLVIVPEDSVQKIEIKEVEESGEHSDKSEKCSRGASSDKHDRN
jgi:hypothetical protein